jgi:hypothetical protein
MESPHSNVRRQKTTASVSLNTIQRSLADRASLARKHYFRGFVCSMHEKHVPASFEEYRPIRDSLK